MTALVYRPTWRQVIDDDKARRDDAIAAFERQREATQHLTRLVGFWMAVGCLGVAALIVVLVLR